MAHRQHGVHSSAVTTAASPKTPKFGSQFEGMSLVPEYTIVVPRTREYIDRSITDLVSPPRGT